MAQNSKLFAKFFLNNEELLMNILNHHAPSYCLLSLIAQRARMTDDPITGLKEGECYIGDYEKIGLSERQYRTAKDNLNKWTFCSFKATGKGTIAKMLPNPLFGLWDKDKTTDSRRTADGQPTTNRDRKIERKKDNTTNQEILKLYRDKNPQGSTRFRFYDFFLNNLSCISTSLDSEKLEAIEQKLNEFREKLGDEKARLELQSFTSWHKENGSEFKSIIARLNTWLANKISKGK